MDFDTIFVMGLLAIVLAIPAFVSAFADQRRPYFAFALFASGGGAIGYAVYKNPGLYTPDHIMESVFGVIAAIVT